MRARLLKKLAPEACPEPVEGGLLQVTCTHTLPESRFPNPNPGLQACRLNHAVAMAIRSRGGMALAKAGASP